MAFAFRFGEEGFQYVFDSRGADGSHGVYMQIVNVPAVFRITQRTVSANKRSLAAKQFTVGNDYLVIVSRDQDTNSVDFWVNTTTVNAKTVTWNATTSDIDANLKLTSNFNGTQAIRNGTRFYGMYIGNEHLDDTKVADIKDFLETRHGRTYDA